MPNAFLIDPFTNTIDKLPWEPRTPMEFNDGIYRYLVSESYEETELPDTKDRLLCDANGFAALNQRFIQIDGLSQLIPGRCLVLGKNDSQSPTITMAQLGQITRFSEPLSSKGRRSHLAPDLHSLLYAYASAVEISATSVWDAHALMTEIRSAVEARLGEAEVMMTGSFGNRTEVAGHSDVDFVMRFRSVTSDVNSTEMMNRLAAIMSEALSNNTRTEVLVDSPAIAVRTMRNGRAVSSDVIVAAAHPKWEAGIHMIPDGCGGWMESLGSEHKKYVRQIDRNMLSTVTILIRLIKAWKYEHAPSIKSCYLELSVARFVEAVQTILREKAERFACDPASDSYLERRVELEARPLSVELSLLRAVNAPLYAFSVLCEDWAESIDLALRRFMEFLVEIELSEINDGLLAPIRAVSDADHKAAMSALREGVSILDRAVALEERGISTGNIEYLSQFFGTQYNPRGFFDGWGPLADAW